MTFTDTEILDWLDKVGCDLFFVKMREPGSYKYQTSLNGIEYSDEPQDVRGAIRARMAEQPGGEKSGD